MSLRRATGVTALVATALMALALVAAVGKAAPASASLSVRCSPSGCLATSPPIRPPKPSHSPQPTDEVTPAPPTATIPPTPPETAVASLAPDGTQVAGGAAATQDTPHGLLPVPQQPVAAAHPSGGLTVFIVLLVALGLIALTATTLAFTVR